MDNQTPAQTDEFVRVGKVKDAHGIKGELFIILFAGEAARGEAKHALAQRFPGYWSMESVLR